MSLAGVTVRRGDRGATPVPLDDVSTRFEAVICQRGAVGQPIVARSWAQLKSAVGDHTTYSTLRGCESHFAEGGGRVVVSRVVGPAATTASLALRDRDSGTVLTLTAAAPGDWYHGIRVTVAAATGNDRVVTLTLDGDTLVTGTCTDAEDVQDLVASSGLVTAAIGAGVWPIVVVADQALAGGSDDRASITDTEVGAALDAIDENQGPGSICASGWTTASVHTLLAQHAAERNRFARGDLPDIATASTLIAHAEQIRLLDEARYIQLLAGWPQIEVAGVTVTVPPSGVHTGREARTDREYGPGPGQPCAWTFGEYATPTGISQSWSRDERDAMTASGITILVADQGAFFAEDAITAVDPSFEQYAEVSAMRVTMAIHNECKAVLRQRVRSTIDGHGHLTASTAGDVVAICSRWYERDALYGDTAAEAFAVQVTADPTARTLTGNLELRPSPSVKTVELTITQIAAGNTIEGS